MTCPPQSLKCFSHLTQDAAYVFATRDVTRMVKVFHDAVEALWNLFILLQITASKLGVLFAKCQWLPGFERGLVVQTLRVTVPPPGLEEQQQQHMHEVVLHLALGDGMKDLQSHSVVMGFFFPVVDAKNVSVWAVCRRCFRNLCWQKNNYTVCVTFPPVLIQ